jgi:hypothetical protein
VARPGRPGKERAATIGSGHVSSNTAAEVRVSNSEVSAASRYVVDEQGDGMAVFEDAT